MTDRWRRWTAPVFLVATLCIVFFAPMALMAADDAAGAEKPGLVSPNVKVFLWSAGIFATVLLILRAKAWGPILTALDEREAKIKESLEKAERALEESSKRQREHEEVMARARKEATSIVEEGKRDAQVVREGIVADAKKDAEALTRRAKAEIERAKTIAIDDIHKQSVGLSVLIAEKMIQKSLSPEEHEKLVKETIENYEKAS